MNEQAGNIYQAPEANVVREVEEYDDSSWYSPKGRRMGYLGQVMLVSLVGMIGLGVLIGAATMIAGPEADEEPGLLVITLTIVGYGAMIVPTTILMIKRFHDQDRSGWFSLLVWVPVLNIIGAIMLLFIPGTDGPNRFGPPPAPGGKALGIVGLVFIMIMFIGILAAIAIPAYQDYVQRAEAVRAEQTEQLESP